MCDMYSRQIISEKATQPLHTLPLHFSPLSRSSKVDVWALGCMAYLLAFNRHAFPDGSALATLTGKYSIPPMHSRSQLVLLLPPKFLASALVVPFAENFVLTLQFSCSMS